MEVKNNSISTKVPEWLLRKLREKYPNDKDYYKAINIAGFSVWASSINKKNIAELPRVIMLSLAGRNYAEYRDTLIDLGLMIKKRDYYNFKSSFYNEYKKGKCRAYEIKSGNLVSVKIRHPRARANLLKQIMRSKDKERTELERKTTKILNETKKAPIEEVLKHSKSEESTIAAIALYNGTYSSKEDRNGRVYTPFHFLNKEMRKAMLPDYANFDLKSSAPTILINIYLNKIKGNLINSKYVCICNTLKKLIEGGIYEKVIQPDGYGTRDEAKISIMQLMYGKSTRAKEVWSKYVPEFVEVVDYLKGNMSGKEFHSFVTKNESRFVQCIVSEMDKLGFGVLTVHDEFFVPSGGETAFSKVYASEAKEMPLRPILS